jgi:hypothetical protein
MKRKNKNFSYFQKIEKGIIPIKLKKHKSKKVTETLVSATSVFLIGTDTSSQTVIHVDQPAYEEQRLETGTIVKDEDVQARMRSILGYFPAATWPLNTGYRKVAG